MSDVTIRLGKEGSPEDSKGPCMGKGKKPGQSIVEAQSVYLSVACWNCWAVNEGYQGCFVYWFYCWNCGAVIEY